MVDVHKPNQIDPPARRPDVPAQSIPANVPRTCLVTAPLRVDFMPDPNARIIVEFRTR